MPERSPLSLQVLAPLDTPKGYYGLCHRFFLRNGRESFTYTPSCSRCSISKTKRDRKRRNSNCGAKRNGFVAGPDSSLLCFWFRGIIVSFKDRALLCHIESLEQAFTHAGNTQSAKLFHGHEHIYLFIFTYPSSCSAR